MSGRLIDAKVNVPPIVQQGDTETWIDESMTDAGGVLYTAADWNLVFSYLQNAGTQGPLSVTAARQGSGWLTTLSVSATTALVPGTVYLWQSQLVGITSGVTLGLAVTVDDGTFKVLPNLAAQVAGYDGRSMAVKSLMAWRAAMAALSGQGGAPVLSYKVGTRELRYRDMTDIMAQISYWQAEVIKEKNAESIANNRGNLRKTYARFPSTFGSSA